MRDLNLPKFHFTASTGQSGSSQNRHACLDTCMHMSIRMSMRMSIYRHGRRGKDIIVRVPPGTIVSEPVMVPTLLTYLHGANTAYVLSRRRAGANNIRGRWPRD